MYTPERSLETVYVSMASLEPASRRTWISRSQFVCSQNGLIQRLWPDIVKHDVGVWAGWRQFPLWPPDCKVLSWPWRQRSLAYVDAASHCQCRPHDRRPDSTLRLQTSRRRWCRSAGSVQVPLEAVRVVHAHGLDDFVDGFVLQGRRIWWIFLKLVVVGFFGDNFSWKQKKEPSRAMCKL